MEYTPHWEANLSSILKNYRFKATLPRLDNFGIAVLSKREMSCKLKYYGLENKPSLVARTSLNNKPLTIIATHPVPPIGQSMFQSRNQHLVNILNDRNHLSENLVIIGDLNTSSFSNHFRKLTKAGLKDSRNGFGVLPTWPANFSLLQTTLDHCLVSENIKILERSIGSNTGSDHLPITLKLGLE